MESVRRQKRIVMLIDEDVGRLQIRMHKWLTVQVRNSLGYGERQLVSLWPIQREICQRRGRRLAASRFSDSNNKLATGRGSGA